MKLFDGFCGALEAKIVSSYESGVSMEDAEKLAGEFLVAQIRVSAKLKEADLSSRMRKSGLKAVRAAVYLEGAKSGEKKPSDALLQAQVDTNELVSGEQDAYDRAEVELAELERYYNIFGNAHIFYRGVAKGNFGG